MGDLILADFKSKTYHRTEVHQDTDNLNIITLALMGEPYPVGMEPVIHIDTSPSEMNPEDCA